MREIAAAELGGALGKLMGELMGGGETLTDAEKLTALEDHYQRYRAMVTDGCPFKPGDMVTPRANSNVKGAGRPGIVLEVVPFPLPHFGVGANPNSSSYGMRLDMRVAEVLDGAGGDHITAFWAESVSYERWAPPAKPEPVEADAGA